MEYSESVKMEVWYDATIADQKVSRKKVKPQNESGIMGVYDPGERLQFIEVSERGCVIPQEDIKRTLRRKDQSPTPLTNNRWVDI